VENPHRQAGRSHAMDRVVPLIMGGVELSEVLRTETGLASETTPPRRPCQTCPRKAVASFAATLSVANSPHRNGVNDESR
jgi:hypothetical protein